MNKLHLFWISVVVCAIMGCTKGDPAPNFLYQDTVKYLISYNPGKLTPNTFSYTLRSGVDTTFTANVATVNKTIVSWFNTGDTVRAIYPDSLTILYNRKKMPLNTYTRKGVKYGFFIR